MASCIKGGKRDKEGKKGDRKEDVQMEAKAEVHAGQVRVKSSADAGVESTGEVG